MMTDDKTDNVLFQNKYTDDMLFEEIQKMHPPRVGRIMLIVCGIVLIVSVGLMVISYYLQGTEGLDVWNLFPLILLPLIFLLYRQKMITFVVPGSLTVGMGGGKFVVQINGISTIRIENFETRRSKYGYGVKYNDKKSYIVGDADEGVWIELKNGDAFLISSRRAKELEKVLRGQMGTRKVKGRGQPDDDTSETE